MTEYKKLKPAPGARVRHPDGKLLDVAGEPVPLNTYWSRRLASGDVIEVLAAQIAPAQLAAPSQKTKPTRE